MYFGVQATRKAGAHQDEVQQISERPGFEFIWLLWQSTQRAERIFGEVSYLVSGLACSEGAALFSPLFPSWASCLEPKMSIKHEHLLAHPGPFWWVLWKGWTRPPCCAITQSRVLLLDSFWIEFRACLTSRKTCWAKNRRCFASACFSWSARFGKSNVYHRLLR